ncbi:hypothetical protein AwDysgo_02380 [Bacteroidales bacterium]|nr:hypothetical protein AwDysgo_02380 [Bacteroidales bacterium]
MMGSFTIFSFLANLVCTSWALVLAAETKVIEEMVKKERLEGLLIAIASFGSLFLATALELLDGILQVYARAFFLHT